MCCAYIAHDLLAATNTVSLKVLNGPAACYAGVHASAESVCQNCVLGRCANLCSIIVVQDQKQLSYQSLLSHCKLLEARCEQFQKAQVKG